ncbi:hypothetical protein [Acrocarpospora phusangensis]|nr:hypothetical protein [Acrocarpospora phusangensis]
MIPRLIRRMIRMFLRWREQAIAEEKACRHDGRPPFCFRCMSMRSPR